MRVYNRICAAWPKARIDCYHIESDSGAFDFFTLAINGKEKVIRPDYSSGEPINHIAEVTRNTHAIGVVSLPEFEANNTER